MTDEEITKYIDMGDIEKGEEVTTERATAELYRWVRVVNSESFEYENLTPKVLYMAIQAIHTLAEISSICDAAEMIIKEEYGVVIPEGYAEVFDLIKQKVEVRNND